MSTKCVRNKSMRLRLKPKDHVKTYSQLFHRPAPTVGCWFLSQGWTCYYRSHSTSILQTLQQVLREGTQFLFLGKPRWNPDTTALSPLLSFLHSFDFTFICEVDSCLCPLANIWALRRSGLLPGCLWPSRTQTQVLSRFSNHLNHTFDSRITEKNKSETSLNIPFHRMLTSELRNILFFKIKIQSRKEQNPLKCNVTTCPLEWLKWQTVTILSAKQDVKLQECSQIAGWNVN